MENHETNNLLIISYMLYTNFSPQNSISPSNTCLGAATATPPSCEFSTQLSPLIDAVGIAQGQSNLIGYF
jgi:hypothetical protein